jgi:hypothetical protein
MPTGRATRDRLLLALLLSHFVALSLVLQTGCGGAPAPLLPSPPSESCSGVQRSPEPCDGEYIEAQFAVPPCPTLAEVEQVLREIPVKIKNDVSAGTFVCREAEGSVDLSPIQFRVYEALLFLSLWQWLTAAIPNGIVIDKGGNAFSCLNCSGPITLAYLPEDWSAVPRSLESLPFTTIIHEARHAEGYNHTCSWDGNKYTHDHTISEMGADGVSYYSLLWLGIHSEQDPQFKRWAKSRADMRRTGSSFCCECGGLPRG